MDLKLIKNLLTLIAESDVDEVSIEEGEFKIKVKKNAEAEQPGYPQMPIQYQIPTGQQPPPPQQTTQPQQSGGQQTAQQDAEEKKEEQPEGKIIKSPIVGTFYRSPSPDDDPFVQVGDQVEKGQTICIVEAMKIMNEIESEFSGEVQKILVEDAEPVEYDQPLFIIG